VFKVVYKASESKVVRVDVDPKRFLWVIVNGDGTGLSVVVNKVLMESAAAAAAVASEESIPAASGDSGISLELMKQPSSSAPIVAVPADNEEDDTTAVVTVNCDTAPTAIKPKGFKAFMSKMVNTLDRSGGQDKDRLEGSGDKKVKQGKKALKKFALKVEVAKEKFVKLFTTCLRPAVVV